MPYIFEIYFIIYLRVINKGLVIIFIFAIRVRLIKLSCMLVFLLSKVYYMDVGSLNAMVFPILSKFVLNFKGK